MRQGSSNLSGSQSALTCLCVCARARLGLREFNNNHALKLALRHISRRKRLRKRLRSLAVDLSVELSEAARSLQSTRGTVRSRTREHGNNFSASRW
jgi:hypothetical protein